MILRMFECYVVVITFHGCRWLLWSGLKLNVIVNCLVSALEVVYVIYLVVIFK